MRKGQEVEETAERPITLIGWIGYGLKRIFGNASGVAKLRAFEIGCTVGAINYLTPKLYGWGAQWLSVPFFIVMILLYIYVLRIASHEELGIGAVKDIIPLIVVMVMFYLTMMSVVWMMSTLWSNRFATGLATTAPKILLVFAIIWFIIVLILYLFAHFISIDI